VEFNLSFPWVSMLFWNSWRLVPYLTLWLLTLQLFKNSIDTQEKLRLNLYCLSELSEYRRMSLRLWVAYVVRTPLLCEFRDAILPSGANTMWHCLIRILVLIGLWYIVALLCLPHAVPPSWPPSATLPTAYREIHQYGTLIRLHLYKDAILITLAYKRACWSAVHIVMTSYIKHYYITCTRMPPF
jgi:hypothetical protein